MSAQDRVNSLTQHSTAFAVNDSNFLEPFFVSRLKIIIEQIFNLFGLKRVQV